MTVFSAPMDSQGGVVIPAAIRREMGLEGSVDLIFRYENDTLTVETIGDAVAYVQSVAARHIVGEGSLADDLMSLRRTETASDW